MNNRIKLNALLSLLLALSLFLSMPVYVLAKEPEEIINVVEETSEETADEPVEAIPEMIYEPFEQEFEDSGEGLFNDPDVEAVAEEDVSDDLPAVDWEQELDDMTDELTETAMAFIDEEDDEDALQDSDVMEESASGTDETTPDFTYVISEPQDEPDEDLLDDPGAEAIAEEDVSEEPQALDLDQTLDDMTDELTETAMAFIDEEDDKDALQASDVQEEPIWSLSLPGSQAIAYKAERTKIGTIAVKDALHFTDGQVICVTLDYSSFHSDTYSIPIAITVIQNGTELVWSDGASCFLNPDGSDPIEVFVYISAEAWAAAPHGAYAMSLRIRSALAGG